MKKRKHPFLTALKAAVPHPAAGFAVVVGEDGILEPESYEQFEARFLEERGLLPGDDSGD